MANYKGIHKRKDRPGWEGFVKIRHGGTRKTVRVHGTTAKEAWDAKVELLRQSKAGTYKPEPEVKEKITTLGEWAHEWYRIWLEKNPEAEDNTKSDYLYAADMVQMFLGSLVMKLDPEQEDAAIQFVDACDAGFSTMLMRGRRRGVTPAKQWVGVEHPARLWARENGHKVADTGKLPTSVRTAWEAAGSPTPPEPEPDTRPWHAIPDEEKKKFRLANMTVVGVRTKFNMMCREAVRRGLMTYNPVPDMKAIARTPSKEKVAFTEEQMERITEEMMEDTLDVQVRWATAVSLAMRQGEVLAMRWNKLNEQDLELRIDEAIERRKWQHGCDDPDECGKDYKPSNPRYQKSNAAARCPKRHSGGLVFKSTKEDDISVVPVSENLWMLLQAHKAEQNKQRLLAGPEWHDNDLVFCTPTGKPIDPSADWKKWKKLLIKYGLPEDAGTHSARHTGITIAFDEGVDEMVVSKVLARHKSGIAFTRSQYQHIRGKRKAGDALRQAMSKGVFGQQNSG